MTQANDQRQPASATPVEQAVRPCGYLHGTDFIPHGPNGWTGGVPVYDQAALDAAVAAMVERWQWWLFERAVAVEAASPLAAKALRNAAAEFEA